MRDDDGPKFNSPPSRYWLTAGATGVGAERARARVYSETVSNRTKGEEDEEDTHPPTHPQAFAFHGLTPTIDDAVMYVEHTSTHYGKGGGDGQQQQQQPVARGSSITHYRPLIWPVAVRSQLILLLRLHTDKSWPYPVK